MTLDGSFFCRAKPKRAFFDPFMSGAKAFNIKFDRFGFGADDFQIKFDVEHMTVRVERIKFDVEHISVRHELFNKMVKTVPKFLDLTFPEGKTFNREGRKINCDL